MRLIRAGLERCARCCLLLNTVARLPSVVVGAEVAKDCCNALCTGLDDTWAASSDAYDCRRSQKLPCVCCVLASVCLAS